jgi:hypothetical protein
LSVTMLNNISDLSEDHVVLQGTYNSENVGK